MGYSSQEGPGPGRDCRTAGRTWWPGLCCYVKWAPVCLVLGWRPNTSGLTFLLCLILLTVLCSETSTSFCSGFPIRERVCCCLYTAAAMAVAPAAVAVAPARAGAGPPGSHSLSDTTPPCWSPLQPQARQRQTRCQVCLLPAPHCLPPAAAWPLRPALASPAGSP